MTAMCVVVPCVEGLISQDDCSETYCINGQITQQPACNIACAEVSICMCLNSMVVVLVSVSMCLRMRY